MSQKAEEVKGAGANVAKSDGCKAQEEIKPYPGCWVDDEFRNQMRGRRGGRGGDWKPRGGRGQYQGSNGGRGQYVESYGGVRYYERSGRNQTSDSQVAKEASKAPNNRRYNGRRSPFGARKGQANTTGVHKKGEAQRIAKKVSVGGSQEATDEEGPKKLLVLLMDCVLPNEFDDASKKLMAEMLELESDTDKIPEEMQTFEEAVETFKASVRKLAAEHCENLKEINKLTAAKIRSDCSTTVRWVKQSLRNAYAASRLENDPLDPQQLFPAKGK
ncbi:uncharacterized protein LOC110856986 [Folsomia candida]|nr:uncharacterized protein LOC110842187 [Folsomia candida]XP_021961271.1 uncharacterized protein LOC110856986 [Folsomia candida]